MIVGRGWPKLVALLITVLVGPPAAAADAVAAEGPFAPEPSVIVVRPFASGKFVDETITRIRSELDAAGIRNQVFECPASEVLPSPTPAVEDVSCDDDVAGSTSSAAARISLIRRDGDLSILVVATMPGGLVVRRQVPINPDGGGDGGGGDGGGGDDPAVLAVRVVELLRDIYLDVSRTAARPVSTASDREEPAPSVARASSWSDRPAGGGRARLFLGLGILQGREGLGPSAAPVVGFGVALGRQLSIVATLAGTFSQRFDALPDLGLGAIDVTQTVGTLGLRYEIGSYRVRPTASLALGVHHLRATGTPFDSTAEVGLSATSVAPLVAGGLGVSVRLWRWLSASAEGQLFVTEPLVVVQRHYMSSGRAGAPSFLAHAGLLASWP